MKLRSKSTHSQHTCRKTIHKQTRRKRRKPLPQEKEARDQTRRGAGKETTRGAREKRLSKGGAREKRQSKGGAGKATKQGGARKAPKQEKGAQTAVRTPFKKDSFCDGSENYSFGFRLRRTRSDRRFTHGAQRVQKSPPNPLPPPPGKPPPGNP